MSNLCQAVDNASSKLTATYIAGTSTSFAVTTGTGSGFGTPSTGSPLRLTLIKASVIAPSGAITDSTQVTVYRCTSRSGDTLSGLAVESGFSDQNFSVGDVIVAAVNASAINDLNGAITASGIQNIPAALLKGSAGALTAAVAGTDYLAPNGNGSALTNLSPAAIAAGTAGISITGNAATATNGVVTTGTYADPAWLTSLAGSKLTGTVVATNGVVTTGTYADPTWLTSLSTAKLSGVPSALLKGSAGAVASAVAGTDYQTPTGNASANTATASRSGEVARTYAARLGDRVNVKDFGAKGDGTTDDTTAIVASLAAVSSGGTWHLPAGTYLCSANLTISQPITIDAWGAVIQYTGGAGVALLIGAASGSFIRDLNVHGLHIKYHTAPDWTTAATGWQITNVAHSIFLGVGASEFQTGFDLVGDAQGTTYCDFLFRTIANCQTGLKLRQLNTGFVTQCTFRNGSWSHGVTPTTANTHVSINGSGASGGFFNGLMFLACSFESYTGTGSNPTTLASIDYVDSLWFVRSRAESGDASGMPVTIGSNGQGVVWLGSAIDNITWSNSGTGNVLQLGAAITGLTLHSPSLDSPSFSGTEPYFPSGASSSGTYSTTISGTGNAAFSAAASGDSASRTVLFNDGRVAFGPGSAGVDGQFRRVTATKWQLVGLDGTTAIDLQITGRAGVGSNWLTFGSAAPTSGTWSTGDVCWNTAVASGQPEGWRCTSGGTPGTWSAMSNHP